MRKGPQFHGSRSSREINIQNVSCQTGGREVTWRFNCFFLLEDEWSRSHRATNQHPNLPWNLVTHGFLASACAGLLVTNRAKIGPCDGPHLRPGQSSAFSAFSAFCRPHFPSFPRFLRFHVVDFFTHLFSCRKKVRSFRILFFRVFAWSGPNCKMRTIRPTDLMLTGIRCDGCEVGKNKDPSGNALFHAKRPTVPPLSQQ